VTLHALDIAEFFVASVDRDSGDVMTHLKLQKLLYYAQGFHLAMQSGQPLFPESLVAWTHGPVVPQVYFKYRLCGRHPIDPPDGFEPNDFPPEVIEIVKEVNSLYGQFTASKLETMTHEEPPWIKTQSRHTISHDLLVHYFSRLVNAGKRNASLPGQPVWPTNKFRFQQRPELSARMDVHREKLKALARRGLPADF
jgi:uncharacterized phage-associated protein